MAYDSEKEELVNTERCQGQTQRKNSFTLLITLASCVTVFFIFTCMGFWFISSISSLSYNLPLNIYIVTSKNESLISKVIPDRFINPPTSEVVRTLKHEVTRNPFCSIQDSEKFDCYPNSPVTEEECVKLGCCYQEVQNDGHKRDKSSFPPLGTPYCFYPQDYVGYRVKSIQEQKLKLQIGAKLERVIPSGFPHDVQQLNLNITSIDENIFQIKITDGNGERFEAPLNSDVIYKNITKDKLLYDVQLFSNGTLLIQRKSSRATILQSNLLQLVYADQFLQFSTLLPTPYIYGLGEHYDRLLKNVSWTRTPLFNRDNAPRSDILLYGTHPFYMAFEEDSNSHGVFLLNSNAMDIILQPTPAITFRSIGGVMDLYVFLGPTPGEVVQQYTQIISHPFMPPYWSLGFHLCRFGYGSVNETRRIWQQTRDAGIPFDTQWNDIDYMTDQNDFTYDIVNFKGLPEFIDELHKVGMHYVLIVDPGITNVEQPGTYPPYDDGLQSDLFIKNSTGDLFIGKVWNRVSTVFPDFSHPKAVDYWVKQFKSFHDIIPFDGAWIDMNEPSNFYDGQVDGCPDNSLDNPPYVPSGYEPLRTHTLCMNAKHYNASHYDEHNLYAYREAIATYYALSNITLNKKRPFIISRASFPGQGYWSGHWSGDIGSNWEDLRYSVYDLLKFNLFGMPMMGSDICGFRENTTVELCARWSALGAFYPFSRNHNDKGKKDQDPVSLGDVVVAAAKNTLTTRYKLLPYLYYLFYRSHVYGETVARPLFFEFPNDPETYPIDEQFLWGPALMIMPALYPDVKTVHVYFPQDIWYNYYTGEKLDVSGKKVTLDAPLDSINLALRGGYIIPHQYSNTTTTESRQNQFFILSGLGKSGDAVGELYWDDGESIGSYENGFYNLIKFAIEKNTFTSTVVNSEYKSQMDLDFVKICGLTSAPVEVTLNDRKVVFDFDKFSCLRVIANVSLLQNFTIKW